MTFATRLKQLREESTLNQLELANIIGVSRSAISMYEVGEREPDFEVEEALADFFNVSLDYLRCRTNNASWSEPELLAGAKSCEQHISLTPHEERLILAYRSQPALQAAVDKLLDIEEEASPSQIETA